MAEIDQLKKDKLELDKRSQDRDRVREERRRQERARLDEARNSANIGEGGRDRECSSDMSTPDLDRMGGGRTPRSEDKEGSSARDRMLQRKQVQKRVQLFMFALSVPRCLNLSCARFYLSTDLVE